jgi:hypothetical protein
MSWAMESCASGERRRDAGKSFSSHAAASRTGGKFHYITETLRVLKRNRVAVQKMQSGGFRAED